MWLSQYDLSPIFLQSNGQPRKFTDFCEKLNRMTQNLYAMGINTLFVQVRPNTDSFYDSKLFPISVYVGGAGRVTPDYDAFGTLCDTFRRAGFSVHAWLNPFRSMTGDELEALDCRYPVAKWFADSNLRGRYLVECNGRYYLNPAYAEVRRLIAQGADEILERYPLAGIHIDDYFYPTTDPTFDADAYAEYRKSGGRLSLADFRRECAGKTVAELWQTAHRHNRIFGVSPGGNTERNYHELYADVALWCRSDGYLDYLCPQIYFGLEHGSLPFSEVCREFSLMTAEKKIPLIIGMSAEKAYNASLGVGDRWAGTGSCEWMEHTDILTRSLLLTATLPGCAGVSLFSYRLFYSPLTGLSIPETADESASLFPAMMTVKWEE